MINSLNTVLEKHLQSLDLDPKLVENLSEYASLWAFQLAPGIEAEMFCRLTNKSDIALSLIVSMDTEMVEEAQNAFTMALAQVTAPITFTSVQGAITVRLQIKTHLQSLNALLAEAILLTRHFTGPLFLGMFELQTGKRTLPEAIEETLKKLQSAGQTA